MALVGFSRRMFFLLVALLPFPRRAWTDSPSPLSVDDFANMFDSIPGTGNGSCLRVWKPSPYPQPKTGLSISLQALADAKDMSNTTARRLSGYRAWSNKENKWQDKTLRLLLFLLFGITFDADFNPSLADQSATRYSDVLIHFLIVVGLFKGGEEPRPKWYCSDDWLRPTTYLIGPDGEENTAGELAAVHYQKKYYNTTLKRNEYYPILLWDQVRNSGYYTPSSGFPYTNFCDQPSLIMLVEYSREPQVTVCPKALISPTTSSLGEPGTHGNAADSEKEFYLYYFTISRATNHELFHVAYPGVIRDQPQAIPADNDWDSVGLLPTDFSTWTTSDSEIAYGLRRSTFLGLAKPDLAVLNADNHAVFSLCIKYPSLDCVGSFTYAIAKRQSLPFAVSPRVAKKLRNAVTGFDGQFNESALYAEVLTDGDRFTQFSS